MWGGNNAKLGILVTRNIFSTAFLAHSSYLDTTLRILLFAGTKFSEISDLPKIVLANTIFFNIFE